MAARKKVTRKKAGTKGDAPGVEKRVSASKDETLREITSTAKRVHEKIASGGRPDLAMPVRALSNVSYDTKIGYLKIGRQRKEISHLKRNCGWDRTRLDTLEGARTWTGHGVFAHNLTKIANLAA